MIKVEFNQERFAKALADYVAIGQVSALGAVTAASRIWLRAAVRLTVPSGRGSIMNKTSEQKKLGEKLVKIDHERLYKEWFTTRNFVGERARKRIDDLLRPKFNPVLAAKILNKLGIRVKPIVISQPRRELMDAAIHSKRGHVHRKQIPFMVSKPDVIAAEIAKWKKNVGIAKSGWKKAAGPLKVKLPAWVNRHGGEGYFLSRRQGDKPFIEFANEVDYAGKNALEDRVMSLSREFAQKQFIKSLDVYWRYVMAGKGKEARAKLQKDTFEAVEA